MDEEDELYTQTALSQLQAGGARPFGCDREVPFESRLRAYTPRELVSVMDECSCVKYIQLWEAG